MSAGRNRCERRAGLGGEALASVGPSSPDDVAATCGAHTDEETVSLFPLPVVRLKSPFHDVLEVIEIMTLGSPSVRLQQRVIGLLSGCDVLHGLLPPPSAAAKPSAALGACCDS